MSCLPLTVSILLKCRRKKAFDRVSFLLDKGIFDDMAPIISDYVLKDKEVSGIQNTIGTEIRDHI